MDSQVTVRFYTVIPMEPGQASFEACLTKLRGIRTLQRNRQADHLIPTTVQLVEGWWSANTTGPLLVWLIPDTVEMVSAVPESR